MIKNFIVMLVLLTPIFLIGCGSELAKVLGTDKLPPDEFTILTKPNLIIPPEYNLRPPAEGEVRPTPQQPSRELQAILFNNSNNSENFSQSEINLMTGADVAESIPNIKEVLDSEMRDVEEVNANLETQIINTQAKKIPISLKEEIKGKIGSFLISENKVIQKLEIYKLEKNKFIKNKL